MTIIELAQGESAVVMGGVVVTATRVQTNYVALGFTAPASVPIVRSEAKRQEPRPGRQDPKEFARDAVP